MKRYIRGILPLVEVKLWMYVLDKRFIQDESLLTCGTSGESVVA